MSQRDLSSTDRELDAIDPEGKLSAMGRSVATLGLVARLGDVDAMLAESGSVAARVPATPAPAPAPAPTTAPVAVVPDPEPTAAVGAASPADVDDGESLDDLFDDVAPPAPDSAPISLGGPASDFLDQPRVSDPDLGSLDDLLEPEPPANEASANAEAPPAVSAEEPEIQVEDDDFAALDALEIDIDD